VKPGDLVSKKYRLLRRLAEGGMGEIWSARNERTNRDFAIKFLLSALARHPEALQRFVREAKATGQLRHPNIVGVLDAGMHERRPYLVMELLTGESLDECLVRTRKLRPLYACVVIAQVARAVAYAHSHKLIHRDLSCANVFLTQTDEGLPPVVKVLDFGVSKVLSTELPAPVCTRDGTVLGSPAYMSPEQACGAEGVDQRTDVWSLGVLLYQCLTGRMPFAAANYNALMFAIASTPHEPLANVLPDADQELLELVEACLVKDREHRLESAQAVFDRLECIAHRLAQRSTCSGYIGGRRATDRLRPLPMVSRRWFGTAPVPVRVLPWGVRAARRVASAPRYVALLAGLVAGCAIGLFGMQWSQSSTDGIQATPVAAQPAQRLPGNVLSDAPRDPLRTPERPRAARAMSNTEELDLVRAVAHGLSVPEPATQTGRVAAERSR
jgi:tRNA A-37 threonylcarbamoyl transferase component Bud32